MCLPSPCPSLLVSLFLSLPHVLNPLPFFRTLSSGNLSYLLKSSPVMALGLICAFCPHLLLGLTQLDAVIDHGYALLNALEISQRGRPTEIQNVSRGAQLCRRKTSYLCLKRTLQSMRPVRTPCCTASGQQGNLCPLP